MVTGGGTAGHVTPALAVLEALSGAFDGNRGPEVLYVGSKRGMERDLVQRAGLRFSGIQAGPLRGRSLLDTAANVIRLGIGLLESLRILGQHEPDAILATGGYVCAPVVVAGWLRRIPILIYLPDVRPGWAIRFLGRFATAIAVTSEVSKAFLPANKVIETGYPARSEFRYSEKGTARRHLGLADDTPVVLAIGGSRGAHSINVAVEKALPVLLPICQVVHVCGREEEARFKAVREGLSEDLRMRYHVYSYLHEELADAMVGADLAISRSGASVMGEYPAASLPSILVPYPYAGGHQRLNARVLAEARAAVVLENERLDELASLVRSLLADRDRLSQMGEQAKGLFRPDAAVRMAQILVEMGARGTIIP